MPAKDLTAVHSHLYASPVGGSGQLLMLYTNLYTPWDFSSMGYDTASSRNQLHPGERIDYWYSSDPKLSIWENVFGDQFGQDSSGNPVCPNNASLSGYGPNQKVTPGQQISEEWNKGPVTPTSGAYYLGQEALFLNAPLLQAYTTAARQDNNGLLWLQLGDSEPAHSLGDPYLVGGGSSSIAFYRNGTLITSPEQEVNASAQGYYLPLLPRPATYQLDWTESGTGTCTGAAMTTDWTFHSSPSDPSASLPGTETCPIDPSRGCEFLPLLFIDYNLQLNYDNQATAGRPFKVTFTVAHQQNAPSPSGVSATVSASFNDGQTWTTPAKATSQGNNQFTATIQQPPLSSTSGFVSLRIRAHDGAGNSVDQTIIRAYGLTS